MTKKIAAVLTVAIVLFVAVYREPWKAAEYRSWLVELFRIGLFAVFLVYLAAHIDVFAAALIVIGFVSIFVHPSVFTKDAFFVLLMGVLWYAMLVVIFEKHADYINYALCLSALIHGLFVLFAKNGSSLMTNPNEESAFLAMCAPSFLILPSFAKLFVVVPIFGIFKIASFNGLLAATVVFLVYAIYRKPSLWYMYLYFTACAVGLFIYYKDKPGYAERLAWWIPALRDYIENNTVFGVGLGNWKRHAYDLVKIGRAHV